MLPNPVPLNDPNSVLVRAVEANDVPLAAAALEAGAHTGFKVNGRWLIFDAAFRGREEMFNLLLDYDADISRKTEEHQYSILHMIAQGDARESMARGRMAYRALQTGLVKADALDKNNAAAFGMAALNDLVPVMQALHRKGANIDHPDFNGLQAAHVAAERTNMLALIKLFMLGANMEKTYRDGDTPRNLLKGSGQQLYAMMELMPEPDWDAQTLTRKDLLEPQGEMSLVPLANPKTLRRIEEVFAKLEAAGEQLTREDWCNASPIDDVSWLSAAAMCGKADAVFAQLAQQGDMLTPEDLRDADGNSTPLAHELASHFVLDGLFRDELWEGKTKREAQAFFHALPDDAKWQVTNLHQLTAELDKAKRIEARLR